MAAALAMVALETPAYLRAVDLRVIARAGAGTPALVERSLRLRGEGRLGAADLLCRAAEKAALPGTGELRNSVNATAAAHPGWSQWGAGSRLEAVFSSQFPVTNGSAEPMTEFLIRHGNRLRALDYLQVNPGPAVQSFLRCRMLTHTKLLPPSSSASGQAMDAALSICGLLVVETRLSAALAGELHALADHAVAGGDTLPLEKALMDFLSLGRVATFDQLSLLTGHIQTVATLETLAGAIRRNDPQGVIITAAVELSEDPARVAQYVEAFNQTGVPDLAVALRYGAGGVQALIGARRRLLAPEDRPPLAEPWRSTAPFNLLSSWCGRAPRAALAVKWAFLVAASLLAAAAAPFQRPGARSPAASRAEHGWLVFGRVLIASALLLLALLLSEPFIAQETQRPDFQFHLAVPKLGEVSQAGAHGATTSFMNQTSLLTLLMFFVLQGLIFAACVVKLAEIRRHQAIPRIRLKLLENEEHLFDAGLYLGFVGTIVSLILVSLGITKFSLMAAYSSTSFGIVFVSIFKIFLLRPARRALLLESEATGESTAPAAAPRLAPAP